MRKEEEIIIEKGRDAGKRFKVTEMSVSKLEKWAGRALLSLFGADVPKEIAQLKETSNAAALASTVLSGLAAVEWEKVEPLYDELLGQIAIIPNPAHPHQAIILNPLNLDAHIDDLSTIVQLRFKVLELSFGFFGEGGKD